MPEAPRAGRQVTAYGHAVWAEADASGRMVVERVLATDPTAYLDSRLAPGSVLPQGG